MSRKEQLRRRALAFAEARYHAQDEGPPLGTVQELMLAYERGYQDARKDARRLLHGGRFNRWEAYETLQELLQWLRPLR